MRTRVFELAVETFLYRVRVLSSDNMLTIQIITSTEVIISLSCFLTIVKVSSVPRKVNNEISCSNYNYFAAQKIYDLEEYRRLFTAQLLRSRNEHLNAYFCLLLWYKSWNSIGAVEYAKHGKNFNEFTPLFFGECSGWTTTITQLHPFKVVLFDTNAPLIYLLYSLVTHPCTLGQCVGLYFKNTIFIFNLPTRVTIFYKSVEILCFIPVLYMVNQRSIVHNLPWPWIFRSRCKKW